MNQHIPSFRSCCVAGLTLIVILACRDFRPAEAEEAQSPRGRVYSNQLTRIVDPSPLLADYPQFVQPVEETTRYEAPRLVDDEGGDLEVRAWRYSYNARGIIEMPNRLRASQTAVIVVHPWGVDDGQGWNTPEPAGVADFCTPEKNHLSARHTREVIDPLLKSLRGRVGLVMYSLPGPEDAIRHKLYRSFSHTPTAEERRQGARELDETLRSFDYRGEPLGETLTLSADRPVVDYFQQFSGLDASARYNHEGFWNLPIPVTRAIDVDPNDVLIYDEPGYKPLKEFLTQQGIRHVLLAGIGADIPFLETSVAIVRKFVEVNLIGSFVVARETAHRMRQRGGGSIVNIASVSGIRASSGRVAYGASKAGLLLATQVMAVELAPLGIRVNAIAPGPIETPLVRQMHTDEARAKWTAAAPQCRYGSPAEVAAAAMFLLDDSRSSFVTGQTLCVDGGFTAAGVVENRPQTQE